MMSSMTPEELCEKRNHDDAHSDRATCDAYEAEDRANAREDIDDEIAEQRRAIEMLRDDIVAAEAEIRRLLAERARYTADGPGADT